MPKFSGNVHYTPRRAQTVTGQRTVTHEGAPAHVYDAQTELFLLAVVNMVGEGTFYETAGARDNRFRDLVHTVTSEDPDWVRRFIRWLRYDANMRSAAVVAAVEYVRAGGPHGRQAIDAACRRADEPAEVVGYWLTVAGKPLPQAIKRGVSNAVRRLYDERSALRYDGLSRSVRMADVIRLCYPTPRDDTQAALFRWLVDRRRDRDDPRSDGLDTIRAVERLRSVPDDDRRAMLDEAAGTFVSWEELAGWLPGGMDAAAWEAILGRMGYMALLRNLRNFDDAGVSDAATSKVAGVLADPENVAKSRQLPYRFYSAWKATRTLRWGQALEAALDASVGNLPDLPGRTLVLIDTSASMTNTVSDRSSVSRAEVAALFGAALSRRLADRVDVGIFADGSAMVDRAWHATSLLRAVDQVAGLIGTVGHSTFLHTAISKLYGGQDRVVVFTDDQAWDDPAQSAHVPTVVTFDLAGYGRAAHGYGRQRGRYVFGGFSDASFRVLPLLDSVRDAGWPF